MKHSRLLAIPLLMIGPFTIAHAADDTLKTEQEKVSYSLGAKTAENFQAQDIDIQPDAFAKGLKDILSNQTAKLTDDEMQDVLMKFHEQQMAKMQLRDQKLAKENLAKSKEFLEANKKKEGIKTLASGLQYKVITEGKGTSPTEEDMITVNYRGTLLDGTEFDSSYKRNQATTFQLKGLIPGWQQALRLMKPGAKWQLFVPPELAYGEKSPGGVIKPNSMLIFDIELISINSKENS